jgi:hypothetical protein
MEHGENNSLEALEKLAMKEKVLCKCFNKHVAGEILAFSVDFEIRFSGVFNNFDFQVPLPGLKVAIRDREIYQLPDVLKSTGFIHYPSLSLYVQE